MQSARKLALQGGIAKYVGIPCRYGHAGVRYTCNTKCVDCQYVRDKGRKSKHSKHRRKLTCEVTS